MQAVLIGYGEIGGGMFEVLSPYHQIFIHDPAKGYDYHASKAQAQIDLLLVALPWSDEFNDLIALQQKIIEPRASLIFSTVPIGTCQKLKASHFPIEARHPKIARDVILNRSHFLGGYNQTVIDFLDQAELSFSVFKNPAWTEFLKLRSTAVYGVNLEFARYCAGVAQEIGLDWDQVKLYDQAYNQLNINRGTPEFVRPVLNPPQGRIGGHCVVPNSRILDRQFPSDFLKNIYREDE
jgi:hypothetical protein